MSELRSQEANKKCVHANDKSSHTGGYDKQTTPFVLNHHTLGLECGVASCLKSIILADCVAQERLIASMEGGIQPEFSTACPYTQ